MAAFKKYDRTILPVLDSNDVLVGVVTVDDVLDVAEKEATEDIQKIGGMEALGAPSLQIEMLQMIRKRAVWLIILFVSEMLTTTAMGFFEKEIERAVVLSLFLPLILSSGGNYHTGYDINHSSDVYRRSSPSRLVACDAPGSDDWICARYVAGHSRFCEDHRLASRVGFLWALLASSRYHYFFSLIGVVLWGSLAGSMLPLVLRRCGLDPAASSAPFVATLVDVTGLIIYFSIAMFVLRDTLLKH